MWKKVIGWEGWYEVSDQGQVRSVDRVVNFSDGRTRKYESKVLAQYSDWFGYPKVTLKRNGEDSRVHVHVLVAEAFIGPRPEAHQVCHNDGNPKNVSAANLRYGTVAENHKDKRRHGTHVYGEKQGGSVLTSDEVSEIKRLRGRFTCKELAEMFGTSAPNVCNIQQGKRWLYHAGDLV